MDPDPKIQNEPKAMPASDLFPGCCCKLRFSSESAGFMLHCREVGKITESAEFPEVGYGTSIVLVLGQEGLSIPWPPYSVDDHVVWWLEGRCRIFRGRRFLGLHAIGFENGRLRRSALTNTQQQNRDE